MPLTGLRSPFPFHLIVHANASVDTVGTARKQFVERKIDRILLNPEAQICNNSTHALREDIIGPATA